LGLQKKGATSGVGILDNPSVVLQCPCQIILSEEVWGRESRLSNQNLFLEKVSASLFHYFLVWILTVASSVVSPWCPVSNIFV
jgi:hypothetical protein